VTRDEWEDCLGLALALLRLNALVFIGYGVAFAFAPQFMSTLVTGAAPSTPAGLVDMRSTYGGMSIGLGILLALAAQSHSTHRLGLLGVLAVMVGMGTTRALGLLTDGAGNTAMYAYLVLEVVVAGMALWALTRDSPAL
jgi:hypothetical protein